MKMQNTRWSPDTCGCVIDLEWDSDVSDSERVHTPKTHKKCVAHANAVDNTDHHGKVHEENTRKNKALKEMFDNLSDTDKKDVIGEDGQPTGQKDFKVRPTWKFNEARELEITHNNQVSKVLMQEKMDAKFDKKVKIL